jgi:hypothetical protein
MNNGAPRRDLRLSVLGILTSDEQYIRVFLYVRYPTI